MNKALKDLTIKHPFMFAAVMCNEDQCRTFLSIVFNTEILQVSVITEKTIAFHPEYHGIRLDVLAIENGTKRRFNVEMQVRDKKNLPKRSRYYHAQMDMDALLTGTNYNKLPDTYVIFICDYDPVGDHLFRYSISSYCEQNGRMIPDGNHTIWLSSKGENASDEPEELVNFLKYIDNPNKTEDSDEEGRFVKSLRKQIDTIKKSREWEGRYMLLEEMIEDERAEAKAEGLAEGRAEGKESTLKRVTLLIQRLAEQNRMDDITKVSKDSNYLEELFKEFNL